MRHVLLVSLNFYFKIDVGVQDLPFQRPSTEVWRMLAATAERFQQMFNDAYKKMQNKAKEDAEDAAAEALALLKTR